MINFAKYEKKIFSQNGEDGVIEAIFGLIGTTNKYFVEFGGGGGECNTRLLRDSGWDGLWMDNNDQEDQRVKKEFVTSKNINNLLDKYNVPQEFDLLSIDIDGQDFWVWKAITRRPRVVVIEYNGYLPTDSRKVVPENEDFSWDGTDYYGAGLEAMRLLGCSKNYTFAYLDFNLVNAFFIRNDCVPVGTQFDFRVVARTNPIKRKINVPWEVVNESLSL